MVNLRRWRKKIGDKKRTVSPECVPWMENWELAEPRKTSWVPVIWDGAASDIRTNLNASSVYWYYWLLFSSWPVSMEANSGVGSGRKVQARSCFCLVSLHLLTLLLHGYSDLAKKLPGQNPWTIPVCIVEHVKSKERPAAFKQLGQWMAL